MKRLEFNRADLLAPVHEGRVRLRMLTKATPHGFYNTVEYEVGGQKLEGVCIDVDAEVAERYVSSGQGYHFDPAQIIASICKHAGVASAKLGRKHVHGLAAALKNEGINPPPAPKPPAESQ